MTGVLYDSVTCSEVVTFSTYSAESFSVQTCISYFDFNFVYFLWHMCWYPVHHVVKAM